MCVYRSLRSTSPNDFHRVKMTVTVTATATMTVTMIMTLSAARRTRCLARGSYRRADYAAFGG